MGELHFGKLGYKFVGRLELTDLFQPELNMHEKRTCAVGFQLWCTITKWH